MSNTARIAKNTLMLYFRRILILLVGLYTVRVKLDILGVEDYGIYNIVGGIVVIFSFFFTVMTNTTQRFLSFSLGENNKEKARDVFSASIIIHIAISIIVIIIAETIGLFIFYKLLNLPPARLEAAFIVYQISIITTVINIFHIPFSATIIAHEKMSFYAFLGFIDVILKLGVVFLLLIISYDKLVIYSVLILLIHIVTLLIYSFYCIANFEIARFRICKDKSVYKQISSFTAWATLGNGSNILEKNGVNVILNMFHGVVLNAAMGIANQVNGAIYSFVGNFQTAFKPQLVKYYAAGDSGNFTKLIFRSSKASFYLLLIIVLPFILNAEFVLTIWLKNVPEYAVIFTQLFLLASLENSISGTLLAASHAAGNIKKNEIAVSCITLFNLPLSFFLLWLGFNPVWILIMKIILMGIKLLWQVIFLKKAISLPVLSFFREVILPVIFVSIISLGITYFFNAFFNNWVRLILSCIVSTLSITGFVILLGITKQERLMLFNFLGKKIKGIKKNRINV